MSKTFRPYEPDQISLMPASMRDWLPSDHLAYFISDVVAWGPLLRVLFGYLFGTRLLINNSL